MMPRRKKTTYKDAQRRSTSPRQRSVTHGNRALTRGAVANKGPERLVPRHQFQITFTEEGVDEKGRTTIRTTGKVLCRYTQPRPWVTKARRRAAGRIAKASRRANR